MTCHFMPLLLQSAQRPLSPRWMHRGYLAASRRVLNAQETLMTGLIHEVNDEDMGRGAMGGYIRTRK